MMYKTDIKENGFKLNHWDDKENSFGTLKVTLEALDSNLTIDVVDANGNVTAFVIENSKGVPCLRVYAPLGNNVADGEEAHQTTDEAVVQAYFTANQTLVSLGSEHSTCARLNSPGTEDEDITLIKADLFNDMLQNCELKAEVNDATPIA